MTHAEEVFLEDLGALIGFAIVLFLPVVICLVPLLLAVGAIRWYRHGRQRARACPCCGTPLRQGLCGSCGAVVA